MSEVIIENAKPKCTMCSNRDGCMDYSDEQLQWGAERGHVPLESGDCKHYKDGNESTREAANISVQEFNAYAKALVKSHSSN